MCAYEEVCVKWCEAERRGHRGAPLGTEDAGVGYLASAITVLTRTGCFYLRLIDWCITQL